MPSSSLAELSGLLWREREVFDQLLELLRVGGEAEETDGLLHSISGLELHRAITAREAAVELGLDGEPSLQDLIECADGEWAAVLAGHRRALQALSSEVRALLGRVPIHAIEGNIYALPPSGGRAVQRSLRDFLS
ncbi:MAG TPA: hypothetical protein VM143_16320 [Acidimicrobiales bacterium]|nr:hypothetical protein [Acidimicrobiales bacterium]